MEISLVLVALILTVTTTLFNINLINYESPIPHSYWASITWNNFRGLPALYGEFDAFVTTELKIIYLNDSLVHVNSYFHPSRSFVKKKARLDNNLFSHELNHFHITEYCARRFRHHLKTHFTKFSQSLINNLHTKYQLEEDSLQRLYDEETHHSYLLGKQKEWETRIDSCLQALEKYTNPTVKL